MERRTVRCIAEYPVLNNGEKLCKGGVKKDGKFTCLLTPVAPYPNERAQAVIKQSVKSEIAEIALEICVNEIIIPVIREVFVPDAIEAIRYGENKLKEWWLNYNSYPSAVEAARKAEMERRIDEYLTEYLLQKQSLENSEATYNSKVQSPDIQSNSISYMYNLALYNHNLATSQINSKVTSQHTIPSPQ